MSLPLKRLDGPLYGPAMERLGSYIGQLDAYYSEHGVKPSDFYELGEMLAQCIDSLEALWLRWISDGKAMSEGE